MARRTLSFALLVFLAVGTLAPAQEPEPQATTPYFPLDVGSVWSYRCGENPVVALKGERHEMDYP